jgi:hypothetical protein
MAKRKGTDNDLLYKTRHMTKDWATRTRLITGSERGCSGRISSSYSTNDTRRDAVKQHEHQKIWKSCLIPVYINKPWSLKSFFVEVSPEPWIHSNGMSL